MVTYCAHCLLRVDAIQHGGDGQLHGHGADGGADVEWLDTVGTPEPANGGMWAKKVWRCQTVV